MSNIEIEFGSEMDFNKLILEKIAFMDSLSAEDELKKIFPKEDVSVFIDRGGNANVSVGPVSVRVRVGC